MIPLDTIGVNRQKEAQFLGKGITCVEELARFFPRKYYDFRNAVKVKDLRDGEYCRVTGLITSCLPGDKTIAYLKDDTGEMRLTWFGGCYYASRMAPGTEWTFCGRVNQYYGSMTMTQPLLHAEGSDKFNCIWPIYSKIKGMSEKYLHEKIKEALSVVAASAVWTDRDALAKSMKLMSHVDALKEMHRPSSREKWKAARVRMDFDLIYQFYHELDKKRQNRVFCRRKPMPDRSATESFVCSLPFSLTEDQRKAADIIMDQTAGGEGCSALITGDVGCGKTAVALIAAIHACGNGMQAIIMAPTQVLAQQHFAEMSKLAEAAGVTVALLTGETKARERKTILKGLEDGSIHILVGTHAVLSPELEFNDLGITIVDEEHRFGTRQKQLLEMFDKAGAHHLSMTATPIPRSYAAAIYGETSSIITIETMPPGRKPVITTQERDREAAYAKLLAEVKKGRQAYVVCPFIEESDNEKFKGILSVKAVTDELKKYCASHAPKVKVACISGDMKTEDINTIIGKFAANEVQILVSTTIVEVGVNVPNATAIAIINAERFGLSALHQLRGRVGRDGSQGYCLLVSPDEVNERLAILCKYTSGFKIAEFDLEMRGPGDILGEDQTGDSAIVDLILRKPKLAGYVRNHFAKLRGEGA